MTAIAKTMIKLTTAFGVAVGGTYAWNHITNDDAPVINNGEITTAETNKPTLPAPEKIVSPFDVKQSLAPEQPTQKESVETPSRIVKKPIESNAKNSKYPPATFIPDTTTVVLDRHGVDYNVLQWDNIRERDLVGDNSCYDQDKDGIADRYIMGFKLTNNGETVRQYGDIIKDNYRYHLVLLPSDYDDPQFIKNITKGEAVEALKEYDYMSGILMSFNGVSKDKNADAVAVYSVLNGEISIARPLADVKVGDFETGRAPCSTLGKQKLTR